MHAGFLALLPSFSAQSSVLGGFLVACAKAQPTKSHVQIDFASGSGLSATAMTSPTFSGQLSLVDFTVDEVARIDPKSQFDPATSTTIHKIEGLLKDNLEETFELCVWIQHSVHRFHDEDWNFITFAGGSRDTIPGTQKFGKGRKVQGVGTLVYIKQR